MSAHTPGPWRQNGPVITAQGAMALIVANVRCQLDPICRPDAAAKDFKERDANARLIAAAPELLAEFKEFADWVSSNVDNPGAIVMLGYAREVIAKAEGKA